MIQKIKQALDGIGAVQSVLGIPSMIATIATIVMAVRARIEGMPWSIVVVQAVCLFAAILAAAVFLLHLKDALSADQSAFGRFKAFLDRKITEGEGMLRQRAIDADAFTEWHKKISLGVKTALGEEIQDKDIRASLDVMESRILGQKFYPNSMTEVQLRENLVQCVAQVRLLRRSIKRQMLLLEFNAIDLKEYV
jgi:hypothetical protein